jgi:uncharacterized membrane protein YedE/YeeE
MNLEFLADHFGDNLALLIGGAVIGAIFGAFAQQSRFCLRAAAIEFSRGQIGGKVAIWLIVFSTAITGTMLLSAFDLFTATEARQLASPQSLSGAAIGGLMFGTGMVLARGCSSRLLVLSATGNLRALLSGLVFAVVAQASLHGFLSPLREALATPLTTCRSDRTICWCFPPCRNRPLSALSSWGLPQACFWRYGARSGSGKPSHPLRLAPAYRLPGGSPMR